MKTYAVGETIRWEQPASDVGTATIALLNPVNGYYLDFADGTLKASAWTTQRKSLALVGSYLQASFNTTGLPAGSQGVDLVQEWVIDGETAADIENLIVRSSSGGASAADVWGYATRALTGSQATAIANTDTNVTLIARILKWMGRV